MSRARLKGFAHHPSAGLADRSDDEPIARVRRIGITMDRSADVPLSTDETQLVEGLTGPLTEPPILVSRWPSTPGI
ncbi:MAG: hypothetical protein ABW179_10835 [Methylobacterium sp.]